MLERYLEWPCLIYLSLSQVCGLVLLTGCQPLSEETHQCVSMSSLD